MHPSILALRPPLAVALVSRSNGIGGGASRVAEELGRWLASEGNKVIHLCAFPIGPFQEFQGPLFPKNLASRFNRLVQRMTRKLGLKEVYPGEYYGQLGNLINDFDIIHFHDLDTAISPLTLKLCARTKPVVFTAHDCSSFTGGCVYPGSCERYVGNCGECPQLSAMGAQCDFTNVNLMVNRLLAKTRHIHYVFPSAWLEGTAQRSLKFTESPTVIPNGFASDPYKFRCRSEARYALGLLLERPVVLVAAHYLADPRKGLEYAIQALRSVADLSPLVILAGKPPDDIELRLSGIQFWLAGFVADRGYLGLLFAAADVYLFSPLQDNLPIMVQEAQAAGTPVVGFATGGIPEMVDHGRTGWLCPVKDQEGLNKNLRTALLRQNDAEVSRMTRALVRDRFDMNDFGRRHLALYQKAVESR